MVVHDHIGRLQQPQRLNRKQVGIARARADKVHMTAGGARRGEGYGGRIHGAG